MTNPGYSHRPAWVTYYFTTRDAYLTDNITRTDISVTYGFKFPALGKEFEIFVIPAVTNVFNEQGVERPNTTVYTTRNSGRGLSNFNPFTTSPIECPQGTMPRLQVHGDGRQLAEGRRLRQRCAYQNYQTPRTFTLSVGFPLLARLVLTKHQPRPQAGAFSFVVMSPASGSGSVRGGAGRVPACRGRHLSPSCPRALQPDEALRRTMQQERYRNVVTGQDQGVLPGVHGRAHHGGAEAALRAGRRPGLPGAHPRAGPLQGARGQVQAVLLPRQGGLPRALVQAHPGAPRAFCACRSSPLSWDCSSSGRVSRPRTSP